MWTDRQGDSYNKNKFKIEMISVFFCNLFKTNLPNSCIKSLCLFYHTHCFVGDNMLDLQYTLVESVNSLLSMIHSACLTVFSHFESHWVMTSYLWLCHQTRRVTSLAIIKVLQVVQISIHFPESPFHSFCCLSMTTRSNFIIEQ